MTIYAQTLYNDVLAEFGLGTGNDRTEQVFIRSVNRMLGELRDYVDNATAFTTIDDISDTIADIESAQEYVAYEGVRYYMIRSGVAPGDPGLARIIYDDSKQGWNNGKGQFWARGINDCQAVDSSSMIGLGYQDS